MGQPFPAQPTRLPERHISQTHGSVRYAFACAAFLSPLHVVGSKRDAICSLDFAYVLHDCGHLLVADLRLRRHVAKPPVMLADTQFGSSEKCGIRVMAGIVDVMNEWRSFVGACPHHPVARRAVCFEMQLAFGRASGKRRLRNTCRGRNGARTRRGNPKRNCGHKRSHTGNQELDVTRPHSHPAL